MRGLPESYHGLPAACKRKREAGAARVWLRVNKLNARAQKAYRAAGFSNVRALCTDIGGGFVMDCSIVCDHCKEENFDAWYETTLEYGKY